MPKSAFFVVAVAVSALCVLVLVGVFLYSGTFLPSTEGASSREAWLLWLEWTGIAAFPLLTGAWAILHRLGGPKR
jgi:hypothetical protein